MLVLLFIKYHFASFNRKFSINSGKLLPEFFKNKWLNVETL